MFRAGNSFSGGHVGHVQVRDGAVDGHSRTQSDALQGGAKGLGGAKGDAEGCSASLVSVIPTSISYRSRSIGLFRHPGVI